MKLNETISTSTGEIRDEIIIKIIPVTDLQTTLLLLIVFNIAIVFVKRDSKYAGAFAIGYGFDQEFRS